MTSGGARARSGPPPDPNALRRDRPSDAKGWVHLPASGRAGDPPAWPLSRPTARKLALWADLWRRPEAIAWEANGQELQVALYVLAVLAADRGTRATASDRKAALSFMDDLGLSNGGRAKNRWVIDDAGPARPEPNPATTTNAPPDARARLLELVVVND